MEEPRRWSWSDNEDCESVNTESDKERTAIAAVLSHTKKQPNTLIVCECVSVFLIFKAVLKTNFCFFTHKKMFFQHPKSQMSHFNYDVIKNDDVRSKEQ